MFENQEKSEEIDFKVQTSHQEIEQIINDIIDDMSPSLTRHDNIVYGIDSSWRVSNSLDYDFFCYDNKEKINSIVNNYRGKEKDFVIALLHYLKTPQEEADSIIKEKTCYLLLKLSDEKNFANIKSPEITEGFPLKLYAIKLLAQNDETPDCYSFELLIKNIDDVRKKQRGKVNSDLAEIHDLVIEQFLKVNEPSERLYESLFNSIKKSPSKNELEQKFIQKLAKYYGANVDRATDGISKDFTIKLLIKATIIADSNLQKDTTTYNDFVKAINEKFAFSSFIKKYNDKKSICYAIDKLIDNEYRQEIKKPLSFLKIYVMENDPGYKQDQLSDTLTSLVENHKIEDIDSIALIIKKSEQLDDKFRNKILNKLIGKHLQKAVPFSPQKFEKIIELIKDQNNKFQYNNTIKIIDYIQYQYEKDISTFFNPDFKNIKNKIVKELIIPQRNPNISKYIINRENGIKWGILNPTLLRQLKSSSKDVHHSLVNHIKQEVSKKINSYLNDINNLNKKNEFFYLIDIFDSESSIPFPSVVKKWNDSLYDKYIDTEDNLDEDTIRQVFETQKSVLQHCSNSVQTYSILLLQLNLIETHCNNKEIKNNYLREVLLLASEFNIPILSFTKESKPLYQYLETIISQIKSSPYETKDLFFFYSISKLLSQRDKDRFFHLLENQYSPNSSIDYRDIICKKLFDSGLIPSFEIFTQLYNSLLPERFITNILNSFGDNRKIDREFSIKLWKYLLAHDQSINPSSKYSLIKKSIFISEKPSEGLELFIENAIKEHSYCSEGEKIINELTNPDTGIMPLDIVLPAINTLLKKNEPYLSLFCYKLALNYKEIQKKDLNAIIDRCLVLLFKLPPFEYTRFASYVSYEELMNEKLGVQRKHPRDHRSYFKELSFHWSTSILTDRASNTPIDEVFFKEFVSFLVNNNIVDSKDNIKAFIRKIKDAMDSIDDNYKENLFKISNIVFERLFRATEELHLSRSEKEEIRQTIQGIFQ